MSPAAIAVILVFALLIGLAVDIILNVFYAVAENLREEASRNTVAKPLAENITIYYNTHAALAASTATVFTILIIASVLGVIIYAVSTLREKTRGAW